VRLRRVNVDRPGFTRRKRGTGFSYLDAEGNVIRDAEVVERIRALAIPPAWQDVWISPSQRAKLQATGRDKAGRKQYLYHPDYRAAQEQAKYDKLIRFAEKLPDLRATMAEHLDKEGLDRERVSAIALRLINLGWFRVGSEQYARESGTYGITTLTKRHVTVRGNRIALSFRGKHRIQVRTTLVDEELAAAMKELLAVKGARVFEYEWEGAVYNLTSKRLNDYVKLYLGPDFTAKDFRTWGGTLTAAVALAERASRDGFPETKTDTTRSVSAAMRRVAAELGNTPAVCRASYVSPAVIDQYLEGRTLEDFRPPHLRVVGARDIGLDAEEQALLSLLRSWRIRQARAAA
jgi:DNA topoisomerase I